MSEQLTLIASEPREACTKTLMDLVAECAATKQLPLWAQIAGETWFQRALAAAPWWHVARIAWVVFGRQFFADECEATALFHFACLEAWSKDDAAVRCAECEATARQHLGAVSLEMVRVGLERRRGAP